MNLNPKRVTIRPAAIKDNLVAGIRYDLAELNGEMIGLVAMRDNSHLYNPLVAGRCQRRGIARRLRQVALARSRGAASPDSISVNASRYAVAVYTRPGFVAESAAREINGLIFVPMKHKLK